MLTITKKQYEIEEEIQLLDDNNEEVLNIMKTVLLNMPIMKIIGKKSLNAFSLFSTNPNHKRLR